jgi:CRP-like cAMP-binding protein
VSFVNLTDNGLISQLPEQEQSLLLNTCLPVSLKAGQWLNLQDSEPLVYFLAGATVAMMVQDEHHAGLAVGLLGAAHAVGLDHVLNSGPHGIQHRVQSAGQAWYVQAPTLQTLALEHPAILNAISHQLWLLVTHVASLAANIQTLDIQARLAAWLVLSAQTAQTNTLQMTHEHLAQMLGVRRVSITLAAGHLRDQGLLTYSRGQVHILNLPGLARAAQSS